MVDPIIFMLITILGGGLGFKLTSTQNPVYSGLYLVLLFFLGSAISFLLGLEFMALLFLLVYAGAIAVLVLFVVMMLDVKAIENPWSAKKKRLFYIGALVFICLLISVSSNDDLSGLITREESIPPALEIKKAFNDPLVRKLYTFGESEELIEFLHLWFSKERVENFYGVKSMWFVEFDSSNGLNDLSYLLYSTHAILLIIAGVILLIAMVGAISLTLQKNCPESLYRQLGRESRNAVFSIKEKSLVRPLTKDDLKISP